MQRSIQRKPIAQARSVILAGLALLVSGGHSMIVQVDGVGRYRVLGDTVDDAVGEAFDKTAKLLGLPYPGGPALAELAQRGDPERFDFPRPMVDRPGLDFSFSGLKTFALNTWKDADVQDEPLKAELEAFIGACRGERTPFVDGRTGRAALQAAITVRERVEAR